MTDMVLYESPHVIVCCGNVLRGDDGFGSFFFTTYRHKLPGLIIDAGSGAGPLLNLIASAEHKIEQLIIIDAGDFRGIPGEIILLGKEDFLCQEGEAEPPSCFLEKEIPHLPMDVKVILVQVHNTSFSYGLSQRVEASLSRVFSLVSSLMEEKS
ncbi:MAG: hydrogenase maturation protease [Theionarchaea archaeon]|nr:hydrogenase maturation protease [Theionarchaea archaeon]